MYAVATGKTRPAAPIEKDSAEQPVKSEEIPNAILEDTGNRGRESTSVRPCTGTSRRTDELRKGDVGPEEGRADPQERGSAGGAPRREETPRK